MIYVKLLKKHLAWASVLFSSNNIKFVELKEFNANGQSRL